MCLVLPNNLAITGDRLFGQANRRIRTESSGKSKTAGLPCRFTPLPSSGDSAQVFQKLATICAAGDPFVRSSLWSLARSAWVWRPASGEAANGKQCGINRTRSIRTFSRRGENYLRWVQREDRETHGANGSHRDRLRRAAQTYGWCDLTVKTASGAGFSRQLARHVETGRVSVTDPAIASTVVTQLV